MSAPAAPSTLLYTVEQVAKRLAVSAKTIRRWIETRELPCLRLGRLIRVSEADLAAFLERHWKS